MSTQNGLASGSRVWTLALVVLLLALISVIGVQGCADGRSHEEGLRAAVVAALDDLAAELAADPPPDLAGYSERLRSYLEDHPAFFGSAAALLDRSGAVIASPYVYRTDDGYATTDLATPSYNIEAQEWFTAPLAANAGVWTEPYFDAGGGNVWMITRALPIEDSEGTFLIITTDLVVDPPAE